MKKNIIILASLLCITLFSFLAWQVYLIKTNPTTSYTFEVGFNKGKPGVRRNCQIGYSATTILEFYPGGVLCEPWLKVFTDRVIE